MDHDRLFKELLVTFFYEFVQLFLPEVAAYLDMNAPIEFLDKEVFTDVGQGEKHEVDLVAKVRFRGEDAFFLIHVENQATAQSQFPKRMFRYFARLHEKYDLPIYPVALFSYDQPQREEPNTYQVAFPDKVVLNFHYTAIQLNRLSWRQYLKQPNPVASALAAKMQMSSDERYRVKFECLRLLATLKLNPAKSELIGRFIESYLVLSGEELKQYERAVAALPQEEQEATMALMTSWKREGLEEGQKKGLHAGKEELLALQIEQRFGSVTAEVRGQLEQLSSEELNELGKAFLDFTSVAELEGWLSAHLSR